MFPVRAAIEAGLMNRLLYSDYDASGLKKVKRATYHEYLKEDKTIYKIKEYEKILKDFIKLSNNVK